MSKNATVICLKRCRICRSLLLFQAVNIKIPMTRRKIWLNYEGR